MQLSQIFQRRMKKIKDGTKSPRVVQQHPPPNADSHLKTKNNVSDILTKPLSTLHRIPTENGTDMLTNGQKHRYNTRSNIPRYNTRANVAKHGAYAIVDKDTGKSLEYRHLIKIRKYKQIWNDSMSNEIGKLAQGNSRVKGTDTMFLITYENIPLNRRKDVTYTRIVVDYRPQKQEKEQTRLTVGGNLINCPDSQPKQQKKLQQKSLSTVPSPLQMLDFVFLTLEIFI